MAQATNAERDAAKRQSWGCVHCGGEGMAMVFHPRYAGSRTILEDRENGRGEVLPMPAAAVVAAHCVCPMGQFMRARVDEESLRRIPRLQDVFDGRSRYRADDPTATVPPPIDPGPPTGGVRAWRDDPGGEEPS